MDAGAKIIGGCCGTSPQHIAAMRKAMDAHTPAGKPSLEQIRQELGEVSKGAIAQLGGDLSVAGGSVSGGVRRKSRRSR
jgi:5-methyltetrahydrofolate--homocysteine methyltransferase